MSKVVRSHSFPSKMVAKYLGPMGPSRTPRTARCVSVIRIHYQPHPANAAPREWSVMKVSLEVTTSRNPRTVSHVSH
ncbi:hypothetical protein J6590_106150 [Homalodisca vitripennis]|nr:hypothetical protein J6590_106150 [Homalodisca vitripennis]